MDFQQINSFLAPIGLIIAGVFMKLSKNNETFGFIKKYWLWFIILGALLLRYDLFMQAFKFISALGCRCSACNWSSRRYNKEFIQGSLSPSIQDYTQLVCPRRGP